MCKDVLPYKDTMFPNLVGDQDVAAMNRSLLFFQYLLKVKLPMWYHVLLFIVE